MNFNGTNQAALTNNNYYDPSNFTGLHYPTATFVGSSSNNQFVNNNNNNNGNVTNGPLSSSSSSATSSTSPAPTPAVVAAAAFYHSAINGVQTDSFKAAAAKVATPNTTPNTYQPYNNSHLHHSMFSIKII